MYDTEITVVGNALTAPARRQIEKTNVVVTTFRIVSNARRYDRETGTWVDGNVFRIKVNCWRRLGDHVYNSVKVGDPIIVKGRIATREWKNAEGELRSAHEIEATTVGHDLNRGTALFERYKPDPANAMVEDADFESRVNGEPTRLLESSAQVDAEGNFEFDDFPFAEFAAGTDEPLADDDPTATASHGDAVSILREAGLDPNLPDGSSPVETSPDGTRADMTGANGTGADGTGADGVDAGGSPSDLVGAASGSTGRSRRRSR